MSRRPRRLTSRLARAARAFVFLSSAVLGSRALGQTSGETLGQALDRTRVQALASVPSASPMPAHATVASQSATAPDLHAFNPDEAQAAAPALPTRPEAGPLQRYILPGQAAPALTPGDKILMGFRDSASPFSVAGWVFSATYEQIVDGPPNYAENGKGYAQRLGAAAARGTSKNVFSTSLFAPIFHQDPRYYRLGRTHGVAARIFYAASRTFVTRTDSGTPTINLSLLLGTLGSTSIAQAYYPPVNRGFDDLARTYGESLGSDMFSMVLSEFLSETVEFLHLNPTLARQ